MKGNWQYVLLAFALAVVAWYFVSGREKVETWVEIPIQLTSAPENMLITQGLPSVLKVRIRGPRGLIQRLDKSTLAYSLNLTNLKSGENLIPVRTDEIALSSNFEVMELSPPRFKIMAELLDTKMVRVEPVVEGTLDPDYVLLSQTSDPPMVEIRGPVSLLKEIETARTQIITLDTETPGVIGEEVALDVPDEVEVKPQLVSVRLEYGERTEEWSPTVKIDVENMTGLELAGWWPRKVRLQMTIPVSLARDENVAKDIRVWAVAVPGLAPGEHELELRSSLPEGCTLLTMDPETTTITLKGVPVQENPIQAIPPQDEQPQDEQPQ